MTTIGKIESIINNRELSKENIAFLLGLQKPYQHILHEYAGKINDEVKGNKVHFRGLIEFSNICTKDCYYCGIRKSNHNTHRYTLLHEEILNAADFAFRNGYGSVVLQSGERSDRFFVEQIDSLLQDIKKISGGKLGITLSVGEQTEETYQRWYSSGAHRYLLRIESSSCRLFERIHPQNALHMYDTRLECLQMLKRTGYQTGTGVMIGLPHQTLDDLASDILFFQLQDVDMIGMGPYIEHRDTPLFAEREHLWLLQQRFDTALNMIAVLRIVMPDINIAAATALQAIDPMGREKALLCGANIIMPNITPTENRKNYLLYRNKPNVDEGAEDTIAGLLKRIQHIGKEVAFDEWGDSQHYFNKVNNRGSSSAI
ncbi:MAG: [FeFe] hydrogenase H-cluster radical SAM maturase HydE [Cytophagaceae bacterium]|jgi:biotin synthase|nr:[FeFe] hydrogenase H-cluster radical SAM maturase HydE [Cytophagaceae bacterium]